VGNLHGHSSLESCGVLSCIEEQQVNCESAEVRLYTEVMF
jgi:hypothetical protein